MTNTSKRAPLITFANFSDPGFRVWYETFHGGPIDWDDEEDEGRELTQVEFAERVADGYA